MKTSTLNNLDSGVWNMVLDHLYVPEGQPTAERPEPSPVVDP